MLKDITNRLKEHYRSTFLQFGPTSKGVDWGKEQDVLLRHKLMLDLILLDNSPIPENKVISILDVGCGYGAFYEYINQRDLNISYTGIDIVEDMINYAAGKYLNATFIYGDFLETENIQFDYLVCNGILTQKLTTSIMDMDNFANNLIRKMFATAKRGISFNIMSTKVNFMADNLYYRHPVDILAFCLNELTHKVRIEHSYNLFDYYVYLYKSSD